MEYKEEVRKSNKFKVLGPLDLMGMEKALNSGWVIDSEGTEITGVIILYKE